MNTKLQVTNLAASVSETDLINLFSAYGNVAGARVQADPDAPSKRGFGFVTMMTSEGAAAARRGLNGKAMGDLILVVSEPGPTHQFKAPRRLASHLF